LVKVGSSLIVDREGRISIGLFGNLIDQISQLVRQGRQVILVSSGSIALGKHILGQRKAGRAGTDRECAAAGQMKIMAVYDYLFQLKGVPASQILLANDDFFVEERRNNLRGTIENLLHHGVVPVLNENDVTTHRNGDRVMLYDNDSLASLISVTLDVELAILLTDVDGLHKFPPGCNVQENPVIHTYTSDLELDLNGKSSVGRGGMASKIESARLAANSSNPAMKAVVIANGHRPDTISRIMRGELVGTLFVRDPSPPGLQREHCRATVPGIAARCRDFPFETPVERD
jgi:glutamate 5-kinase